MNEKLDRLVAELRGAPCTAREIARRLSVSKYTAYVWIRALIARGEPVYQIKRPSKKTGPVPIAYGIQA